MDKRVFYIKANRTKWQDELEPKNDNLDWNLVKDNEEYQDGILFDSEHMIKDYFEQAREGDIVIMHSTHTYNKNANSQSKFVPAPRIVGLTVVAEPLHFDEKRKANKILLSTQDMRLFNKPIQIRDLDWQDSPVLKNAEPFKMGTNRFTMTSLNKEEYSALKEKILHLNPDSKSDFDYVEDVRDE